MKKETLKNIIGLIWNPGIPAICYIAMMFTTIEFFNKGTALANYLDDKSVLTTVIMTSWIAVILILGFTLLGMILMSMLRTQWDIRKKLEEPKEELQP